MNNTYTLVLPRLNSQSITLVIAYTNAQANLVIKSVKI